LARFIASASFLSFAFFLASRCAFVCASDVSILAIVAAASSLFWPEGPLDQLSLKCGRCPMREVWQGADGIASANGREYRRGIAAWDAKGGTISGGELVLMHSQNDGLTCGDLEEGRGRGEGVLGGQHIMVDCGIIGIE